MITLIQNGELPLPSFRGRQEVLILGRSIARIGSVDRKALEGLGVELRVMDASGCYVLPGIIDPHQHLIGGSGEKGFGSQTPEIRLSELVTGGITTVVGTLGVDTACKSMPALIGKAKGLRECGLSAFVWTGGYTIPPTTLTGSVRDDILFLEEVIGAGEIAIADERSSAPTAHGLAQVVSQAYIGGILSGKAGVTHFHVGDGPRRLALLKQLLAEFDVKPNSIYPTHVERSKALMEEAIELTRLGCCIDLDIVEEDLVDWLRLYFERGANPELLTVSSDAAIISPATLFNQIRSAVLEHGFSLEQVWPLVSANPARVLKLPRKGRIEPGYDADILVLEQKELEVVSVLAQGKMMLENRKMVVEEPWEEGSNRRTRS